MWTQCINWWYCGCSEVMFMVNFKVIMMKDFN